MGALAKAKIWAKQLKRDILALWIAARDPRVPFAAKLVAGAVAAYALSPIDLIPDFIPILGYLDDLLIVPLGVLLAVRLIPPPIMMQLRAEASTRASRPRSYGGLAFILVIWLACIIFIGWIVARAL